MTGSSEAAGFNRLKFSGAASSLEPQSALSSGEKEMEQTWQSLSPELWAKTS